MERSISNEMEQAQDIDLRRMLEALTGVPVTDGNEIDILRNGDEIFPALLAAIGDAERTIDFLTFIYWSGDIGRRFADALCDAASRGVRVRVLLDALGARDMSDELTSMMTDGGCDVRWFRPVDGVELVDANHRTHRKVLVCDETLSFTGGVGIADEWSGDARNENEWRDTHFRVRGPATDGLRAAFVHNWAETDGELYDPEVDRFPPQPRDGTVAVQVVVGDAEAGWTDIRTLFHVLVTVATKRLRIATAYFSPDDELVKMLVAAVERGVQVEVLVPGPHADKRFAQLAGEALYSELLEGGVDIWNFQPSMLHTKVLTVDGLVSTVGSSNFNGRSTQYDEEVNLVIFDEHVTSLLDSDFDDDLARSERIDPTLWKDRGPVQRAKEAVLGAVDDVL